MHPLLPVAALSLLAVVLHARTLDAQTAMCAPTPESAVAGAFRASGQVGSDGVQTGYRVQDVVVDPLTKRIWVRVRRCDSDSAPALLVPMQASLGSPMAYTPEVSALVPHPAPAPPRVIAVQPGDAIRVVMDGPLVHMEVEGKALQQAALGDSIEVELRRVHDEPPHRLLGTLRAGHTVEVQP